MAKSKKSKGCKNNPNATWNAATHSSRLNRKLEKQERDTQHENNYNDDNHIEPHDDDSVSSVLEEEEREETTIVSNQKGRDHTTNNKSHKVRKIVKNKVKGYQRSMVLSHDTYEKRQDAQLRLHISKIKRDIEKLRIRLEAWDEVEEQSLYRKQQQKEEEENKRKLDELNNQQQPKKKKGRLGPETWKLRGAARPAWEVYDFDTRYVDPHLKAHEEAKAKAKRSVNVFVLFKGCFGQSPSQPNVGSETTSSKLTTNSSGSALLIETCRRFLSYNMQYALLNLEAKKFKSARESFLEIIDLEGSNTLTPITNARCRLMRMYLEANRPDSARRLWERLPKSYSSVWIRYSACLLEYVSWYILKEEGSTEESAEALLVDAIRANVFCAYYIAFHGTFVQVMEYTDEVEEDAEDGSLEQAIEYCNSEQMGSWVGTDGAIDWIRSVIVRGLNTRNDNKSINHGSLSSSTEERDVKEVVKGTQGWVGLNKNDLEWEDKLAALELEFENSTNSTSNNGQEQKDEKQQTQDEIETEEENNTEVDLIMFAGMFRTAMDMISDAGGFIL